jgi:hypothetical protein
MQSRNAKLKFGITYWVSATAVFGIIGWTTVAVVDLQKDLSQVRKDRAALAQQVEDLGGTPVAGPRGAAGQRGTDGRDGTDGNPGTPGANGSNGANGSPGKAGSDGTDGVPGADGSDGKDGADGRDGVDGVQGPVGPQGEKGDQGEPGPTCPEGYELRTVKYSFTPMLACVEIRE